MQKGVTALLKAGMNRNYGAIGKRPEQFHVFQALGRMG